MKLIHIIGCRPNFIKLAPVYRAAQKDFEQIIIHTGQHYNHEMNAVFFDELELPEPNANLGVREDFHGVQTGEMLRKIELGLLSHNPEKTMIVVYGDTNSTLAGALAAKKLKFRVAHVEAGMRCFNRNMPEEINRIIVDAISDLLFYSSQIADGNVFHRIMDKLDREFFTVGDVMYDQFLYVQDKIASMDLPPMDFILVTIHREENTKPERFKNIIHAIFDLTDKNHVLFPIHPRTGKILDELEIRGTNKIEFIKPVSYLKMLALEKSAKLIITDSGGVQKEAFWFAVPCITLRDKTEWPETVKLGGNILVDPDSEILVNLIEEAMITFDLRKKVFEKNTENPYGDGEAAEKIVKHLKAFFS